jgi:hypothetical protein
MITLLALFGGVAEGLGSALQKRVHRFKSGHHLQQTQAQVLDHR